MFSLEISLYKSESVEDVSFAELLRNGIFSYLCSLNEKLLFEVNGKSSFLTGEGSATAICVCDSGDGGCGKGRTGLARQHRANV